MNNQRIATVGDLIAALDHYDPATPVRLAAPPSYPMEYALGQVAYAPDDANSDAPVVWLGIGDQVGYLPTPATDALRWS